MADLRQTWVKGWLKRSVLMVGIKDACGFPPCSRCGMMYPEESFPELHHVATEFTTTYGGELRYAEGDAAVEEIIGACEKDFSDTFGSKGWSSSELPHEVRIDNCSRAMVGGSWLLFRSLVESRDGKLINKMCCLPPHVETISDNHELEKYFRSWFQTRWPFLLLWGGGIEYVLESDEEAGRSTPPLFAIVYKALIKLYNKARSHKIPGFASGSFLQPLLKIMIGVPTFASDLRVKLALTTIKQLESFEKTAFLFSRDDVIVNHTNDFLQHNGIYRSSALALACRTCRLDLVSAVLKAGSHLADLPDNNLLGFYPLHHASLPIFSRGSVLLSLNLSISDQIDECKLRTASCSDGQIRRVAARTNFICGGWSWSVIYWVAGETGSVQFSSAHLCIFLADVHQLSYSSATNSKRVICAGVKATNHQGISFSDDCVSFGIERPYCCLSIPAKLSIAALDSALTISFSLLMSEEESELKSFEQQVKARQSDQFHIIQLLLEQGSKENNVSKPLSQTTLDIAGLWFLKKTLGAGDFVITHSDLLEFNGNDGQQVMRSQQDFVDAGSGESEEKVEIADKNGATSQSETKNEKQHHVEGISKASEELEPKSGANGKRAGRNSATVGRREKVSLIEQMVRELDWLQKACILNEDAVEEGRVPSHVGAARARPIKRIDEGAHQEDFVDAGHVEDDDRNDKEDEDIEETENIQVEEDSQGTAAQVEDDVETELELRDGVCWELRFTREFKEVLYSLKSQPVLLRSLLLNLSRLAAGEQGRSIMKQLKGSPKGMQIMESPCKTFNDGPRFLWQYAVDYSPKIKNFVETIRLWRICLQHDDVSKGMEHIINSYKRGRTSTVRKHLRPAHRESCMVGKRRLPRQYVPCDDGMQVEDLLREDLEKFETLEEEGEDSARAGQLVYTPPAIAMPGSYNIVKFYELSDDVRRSILASLDLTGKEEAARSRGLLDEPELPFILDEHEDELISAISRAESVLLVGRSGTGKTSIAIGRMWSMQKQWRMTFGDTSVKYHQIFLTASKVLRDQVRRSYEALSSSSRQKSSPPPPPSLKEVSESQWPLFLTQAEWLRMIDATLDTPFFPRAADGSMVQGGRLGEEVNMLEAIPDEDDWLSDDEDFFLMNRETAKGGSRSQPSGGSQKKKTVKSEVDFPFFCDHIWPKLSSRHKATAKGISASAVFQEIMSYIKGSYLALDKPSGRLSREDYLFLGAKMAPNFKGLTAGDKVEHVPGDRRGHRDIIYDLYESYEEEKTSLGAYDLCDVVFHIWSTMQRKEYAGKKIHSIYVDETQDFTQAELRLMLRVCEGKNDMFFCGDTAQTIASGVAFRFEDLRAIFKSEQEVQVSARGRASGQEEVQGAGRSSAEIKVPQVISLSTNYRTHNGILRAASCIVDLLSSLFPSTVDLLPRERGFFDGPKPILLDTTSVEDATLLIMGSDKVTSRIEFGAHQVVLVRSQEAKKKLPKELDGCLAMTILESKGLEFDDVFLWNFFADSRADQEWRVVLNYLGGGKGGEASVGISTEEELERMGRERATIRDTGVAGMLRALDFSDREHQVLCEELKCLYTALTRARARAIIYDTDLRKRTAFYYFLKARELVQVASAFEDGGESPTARSFATATSAEEWRKQGMNLMERGLFDLATKCFARSGDEDLLSRASGLALTERARRELGASRKAAFLDASHDLLRSLAPPPPPVARDMNAGAAEEGGRYRKMDGATVLKTLSLAGRCLYEAGEFELAGDIFVSAVQLQSSLQTPAGVGPQGHGGSDLGLSRDAVRCYRKAGLFHQALDVMVRMGKLPAALRLLKEEHKYDRALELLERFPDFHPPPDLSVTEFSRLAAASYAVKLRRRNVVALDESSTDYKALTNILSRMSEADEVRFLRRYGFYDVLVQRFLQRGAYTKAAEVLCEDNKVLDGVRMLEALDNPGAVELSLCADLYVHLAVEQRGGASVPYYRSALSVLQRLDGEYRRRLEGERESVVLQENVRFNRLHMLQIKLEICNRVESRGERRRQLLESAQEADSMHCTFGKVLAGLGLVFSSVGVMCQEKKGEAEEEEEETSGGRGEEEEEEEAEGILVLVARVRILSRVIQLCLRSISTRGGGREEAELLGCEQFLGLRRTGGMLTIKKTRSSLLLHNLQSQLQEDNLSTYLRPGHEDTLVVQPLLFRERLRSFLQLKYGEMLREVRKVVVRRETLGKRVERPLLPLGLKLVLMWLTNLGRDLVAQSKSRSRGLGGDGGLGSWFSKEQVERVCTDVSTLLLSSEPCMLTDFRNGKLEEANILDGLLACDAGRRCGEEDLRSVHEDCRSILRSWAFKLHRDWSRRPLIDKDAKDLSLVLLLLRRLNFKSDCEHLILQLPRDAGFTPGPVRLPSSDVTAPDHVRMLLVCGLPGSGKSLLASQFEAAEWLVISEERMGSLQACEEQANYWLKFGHRVVIDAYNVEEQERARWIRVSRRCNLSEAAVVALLLDVPVHVCKNRVQARESRSCKASLALVDRIASQLRRPTRSEGFGRVEVIKGEDDAAVTDLLALPAPPPLTLQERTGFGISGWHPPMVVPQAGWHPPLVLGYNAFAALHRSFLCCKNDLVLSSSAYQLTHLQLHSWLTMPMDAWTMLQHALVESVVSMSWFECDAGGGERAATSVCWLPLSHCHHLVGSTRSPPRPLEADASWVLRNTLNMAVSLVRRRMERSEEDSSPACQDDGDRISIIIWTALLNLLLHKSSSMKEIGAEGGWTDDWAPFLFSVANRLSSLLPTVSHPSLFPPGWRPGTGELDKGRPVKAEEPQSLVQCILRILEKRQDLLVAVASPQNDAVEVGATNQEDLERDCKDGLDHCLSFYSKLSSSPAPPGRQRELPRPRLPATDVLVREVRSAFTVCRFFKLCRTRFALQRLRTLGEKLQDENLSEDPLDPLLRKNRYLMITEQVIGSEETGYRRAYVDMNGPILLFDESLGGGFQRTADALADFRRAYEGEVARTLSRADVAFMSLHRFLESSQIKSLRFDPLVVDVLEALQLRLSGHIVQVEKVLEEIDRDRRGMQDDVKEAEEWRQELEEHEMKRLALYRKNGSLDSNNPLVKEAIPPGCHCRARHYEHDVYYDGTVVGCSHGKVGKEQGGTMLLIQFHEAQLGDQVTSILDVIFVLQSARQEELLRKYRLGQTDAENAIAGESEGPGWGKNLGRRHRVRRFARKAV
ncbi:hypothetical protein GUITHDRAFT_102129 [Guillardia theta CCMP2712]|uniref:UvrD-like helicase ATP-binding domain-containing protein n=2 Tax=Guillardia theta TaxID=55529 RepID=L1JV11_GUITC|nr:hypothetical protein GUITHDRAFT_102129 [Guillardia theta CCMP2712]EKX52227.1 hypothetical protein GUITHDRAFT_102129 [Guillardia theta CCMP2712]|eukprot:XP_005839207.1 hypothetical protein GUITHDRAFT_102129 [Guillardia theta CCMP2712]